MQLFLGFWGARGALSPCPSPPCRSHTGFKHNLSIFQRCLCEPELSTSGKGAAGGGTRLHSVSEAAQAVTEKSKFKGNIRALLPVGRIRGH